MITFLRLAGLGAAAVWLGGTLFYVLGVDPMFGRTEVLRLLGPLHAGEMGFLAAKRFYLFQVLCASVALIHALAEWLYSGRPLDRRLVLLLALLLAAGSLGRLYVVPKAQGFNARAYLGPQRQVLRQPLSPAQRQAEQSLGLWHGAAIALNVLSLAGVTLYFLQQSSPSNGGPKIFPRVRLRI